MNDVALNFTAPANTRLHLGVCGSVAAYRSLDLLRILQRMNVSVSTTLTPAAQRFVTPLSFSALGANPVYTSMFDDAGASSPFAHLEPGQVAHALLIAPASAAMLSRLAYGQADHLLACQALAHSGPLIIAPAMNPAMWQHAATQACVHILQARGAIFVMPDCGDTACGDTGQGRLADIRSIALATLRALTPQDMQGKRVMVTLGPTREPWDALRFWSNPSTGTMGAALALAAWLRGATVDAICGPGAPLLLKALPLLLKDAPLVPQAPPFVFEEASFLFGDAPLPFKDMAVLPKDAPVVAKDTPVLVEDAPVVAKDTPVLVEDACMRRHDVSSAGEMYAVAAKLWAEADLGIFAAAVADFAPDPCVDAGKFKKASSPDGFSLHFSPTMDILKTLAARKRGNQYVIGFAAESDNLELAVRSKLQTKHADMIVGNLLQDGFGTMTNTVYVEDRTTRSASFEKETKASIAMKVLSWFLSP